MIAINCHTWNNYCSECSARGNRNLRLAAAHSPHRHEGVHETRKGRTGATGTQQGRPLQHTLPRDTIAS